MDGAPLAVDLGAVIVPVGLADIGKLRKGVLVMQELGFHSVLSHDLV